MKWLDSVKFDNLHPAMVLAALRVDEIFTRHGATFIVTSGNDSIHKQFSRHYIGKGLDCRTHHIRPGVLADTAEEIKDAILMEVKTALGPQFFCQIEDLNGPNEHLHIQFNGD